MELEWGANNGGMRWATSRDIVLNYDRHSECNTATATAGSVLNWERKQVLISPLFEDGVTVHSRLQVRQGGWREGRERPLVYVNCTIVFPVRGVNH